MKPASLGGVNGTFETLKTTSEVGKTAERYGRRASRQGSFFIRRDEVWHIFIVFDTIILVILVKTRIA